MFVPFCELGNNSTHHFQDPELLIDVAIMDCKEEITVVQYMLKEVFKNYNPEKRYDIICGCNENDKSEGLFPQKLIIKKAKNRECVFCTKYKFKDSRIPRRNFEGT